MSGGRFAFAAHGGAGERPEREREGVRSGMLRAARAGRRALDDGQPAVEVALALVEVLEDDPLFNAGTGSVLNLDGEVQMDASVMEGTRRAAGGVANLRDVRHPVRVAREVLEHTDHVLLGGEGAVRFARARGFEPHDPITGRARRRHRRRLQKLKNSERPPDGADPLRLRRLIEQHPELVGGTVGAVVRDRRGRLAAATSTGGVSLQMAGRIGDTPLPGAGTFATPHAAASATGKGELIMRSLTTRTVCDAIEEGAEPAHAARDALEAMRRSVGDRAGVIAVDGSGRTAARHGTPHMPHVHYRTGDDEPAYALTAGGGETP